MGTVLQSTRSDRVELPVLTNMKIGNSPGNSECRTIHRQQGSVHSLSRGGRGGGGMMILAFFPFSFWKPSLMFGVFLSDPPPH